MTKHDLLKYIDSLLTQRSDGNIGLLRVRQYVEDNMREMVFRCPSCDELIHWSGEDHCPKCGADLKGEEVHPSQKNDSNTLEALDCVSRKAVIDAVGSMLRRKFGIGGDLAEITLSELPSVQPEQLTLRGWVCPVCGRGLSPYTTVCPCRNGEGWEITCQTKTAT